MAFEVKTTELVSGLKYKLRDTAHLLSPVNAAANALLANFYTLHSSIKWPDNEFLLQFTIVDGGGQINNTYVILVDNEQIFLSEQKSLSAVVKNKATGFGTREAYERMTGQSGYLGPANNIVKAATGERYTPNPYMPRKSRKVSRRNRRKSRKVNKRR